MNPTRQLWGDLRSLLQCREVDVVQLHDVLERWPSPYWRDPGVMSYLRGQRSSLEPLCDPPPSHLLDHWARGEALSLLHIYHDELHDLCLPDVLDPQWGDDFSSTGWQIYEDGDCSTSVFDLYPQHETEITDVVQTLMSLSNAWTIQSSDGRSLIVDNHLPVAVAIHRRLKEPHFEIDCEFKDVTLHPGWPPLKSVDLSIQPRLMYCSVMELSDIGRPHLILWLELIVQLSKHLEREPEPAPDWDSRPHTLHFKTLYRRYALLRQLKHWRSVMPYTECL